MPGSARNARAIVISCFSPALTLSASSLMHRVVALGEGAHEPVDVCRLRRREDLALRSRRRVAVGDVVADGPAEQPRVLQHHADLRAQLGARHRRDVEAVERDHAAVELVEPHDQVDERGLARAGRARRSRPSAPAARPARVARSAALGLVARTRRPRTRPGRATCGEPSARAASGACSSASSSSKTRSADAMPDCKTFAIDATCVSGYRELARVLDERLDVAER